MIFQKNFSDEKYLIRVREIKKPLTIFRNLFQPINIIN